MQPIHVIYEDGVFKPVTPIEPGTFPEGSTVEIEFHVVNEPQEGLPKMTEGMKRIYEILDQSYDTGITDLAERHNELDR